METFVGVDVGAKSVAVAQWRAGRVVDTAEFRQTHEGHQALIKRLKGLTVARVVLEATGVYYLDLRWRCSERACRWQSSIHAAFTTSPSSS